MKVRIIKRVEDDVAALVNWHYLELHWIKTVSTPLDRTVLVDAYSEQWIRKKDNIFQFKIGEICLDPPERGEMWFSNGRHRTNLIVKHQPHVPIAFMGGIPDHPVIQASIIRKLDERDIVEIPDLPIYSIQKLRKQGMLSGYK